MMGGPAVAGRRFRVPAVSRGLLACLVLLLLTGGLAGALGRTAPAPARLAGNATPTWPNLLRDATDLGPSTAPGVSLVATLRPGGTRPLARWAGRHGLRLVRSGMGSATLTGSAPALQAALHLAIHAYRSPAGTTFTAAAEAPAVPPGLRRAVRGLGRISGYTGVEPAAAITPRLVPQGGLTPNELLRAYNAVPLVRAGDGGQGQTVVFFEVDAYSPRSLEAFAAKFHLPPFQVTTVGGQAPGGDQVESDMDIETVHEIAPQAHLVYVNLLRFASSPQASFGSLFVAAAQQVAHAYPGAVWSASLLACETSFAAADAEALDSAVSAAEGHGTTFFAASGDAGGLDCTPHADWGVWPGAAGEGVGIPAALPSVTGVGGTTLSVSAAGDYVGERTWTAPTMSQGTGGGVSRLIARPSYQTGPGVAASGVPPRFREVPDVSADADNALSGTAIISAGASSSGNPDTATAGGGTSLATPIWAALTALMNTYLEQHGGHAVGFINPILYHFLANPPRFPAFHDVTVGANDFWSAGPGYDMVTGVGSPDTANLTQDLLELQKGGHS